MDEDNNAACSKGRAQIQRTDSMGTCRRQGIVAAAALSRQRRRCKRQRVGPRGWRGTCAISLRRFSWLTRRLSGGFLQLTPRIDQQARGVVVARIDRKRLFEPRDGLWVSPLLVQCLT